MRALALLLAPLACATPRGLDGTTGETDATIWIDSQIRLWRGSAKESIEVDPPAFRDRGRLLVEAASDGCRPVMELWAWVGSVYRIEQTDCRLTCKIVRYTAAGSESFDQCEAVSFDSLAARQKKREEIVEKQSRLEHDRMLPLMQVLDGAGLDLRTDGSRYWIDAVRVASIASGAGLRTGDTIEHVRCTPTWYNYYYGTSPRSLAMSTESLRTWIMTDRPIKLRVRRAGRPRWIDLNRSLRRPR